FGSICASLCWRGSKDRETPTRKSPIDKVGSFSLVSWVGSSQCMLDSGKNDDWFQSPRIVVFGVIAVVGAIAWIIWEMTDANPIVDSSSFKSRNFTIGAVAFCLGYAVFFANTSSSPSWSQTQIGYTATWAGLVAAPSGVVAVSSTPFVAR
ncbi:hypothetical protein OY671_012229, partial [Metschnikowia pulcherrima]